jgi:hypothetical protein
MSNVVTRSKPNMSNIVITYQLVCPETIAVEYNKHCNYMIRNNVTEQM